MKINSIILLAILLTFGGCEWIKSLSDVDFDTDLIANVLLTGDMKKAANADGQVTSYNFYGSAVLSLAENEDIEPYMKKLREIDLKSVEVTISGLQSGQTIHTITLAVTGVGTICTHSNITSANNTFTPEIDADKLQQAGKKLVDDEAITLTVTGTSSVLIENIATIVFGAKVTAGALD